jgi:hypothetical protein
VWILIGQTSIEPSLFEFLPVGREEQNGVVIRFAEGSAGEDLEGILKVGVAAVECFSSASTTVNVLIDLL